MRRCAVAGLLALLWAAPAAHAAYDPQVTLTVPTAGGPGSPAALTATITQARGEDATRTIEAQLPGTFGFNDAFTSPGCPAAAEQAGRCPEGSRIGSIRADSPFGRAEGGLYITEDFRLLGLLVGNGLIPLRATGVLLVRPGQVITARFDGLPELPVTRLAVSFEGGDRTPLALPRTCGEHVVRMALTSARGEARTSDHAVDVTGCRALPTVGTPRLDHPRVARGTPATLRWRAGPGVARTDVTLRRLDAGTWRELGTVRAAVRGRDGRLQVGPRWRGRALIRGHYRLVLVAVARDGTRSVARAVDLRVR